jgi:hypothetical protein
MAFFVRFSIRGVQVQKHHKQLFGGSPCQKLLAVKVEGKKTFFLSCFPTDFLLSPFWPFLCMRGLKTPQCFPPEIRPENLKKLQKKVAGRYVAFFLRKGRRRKKKKSDVPTYLLFLRFFEIFRLDLRNFFYGVFGLLMQRNGQKRDKKKSMGKDERRKVFFPSTFRPKVFDMYFPQKVFNGV